jgi:hypothetical protein
MNTSVRKCLVRRYLKACVLLSVVIVPTASHPGGLAYPQFPDCERIVASYEASHQPLISSNPTRNNHSPAYVYREIQRPWRWDCEIQDYYKFDTLVGEIAQIAPRFEEYIDAERFFKENLITTLEEAMRVDCAPTGYSVQSVSETSILRDGTFAVTFTKTFTCGKYPWRDYVND